MTTPAETSIVKLEQRLPTAVAPFHVQGPIGRDEFSTLAQIANIVGNTEFVPRQYRGREGKERLMAALLYGRDQGLPPMIALNEIDVIEGSPTLSASMKVAKARANGHRISREEHRDEAGEILAVTAHGERGDDGTRDSVTWTLRDAERAGLAKKDNWRKHPRQMLWWRAASELCNTLFTDVFLGTAYIRDEIEDVESEPLRPAILDEARRDPAETTLPLVTPAGANGDEPAAEGPGKGGDAADAGTPPTVTVFPNGLYASKTLDDVAGEDPDYLLAYGQRDSKDPALAAAIADYLAAHPEVKPTPRPKAGDEPQETLV